MSEKEKITKYELWYSKEEGYSFFPEDNQVARDTLPSDAEFVWATHATSWEEAQTKKHEYLGWEKYKPMD
jgi:hypothetical protein